MDSLVLKHFPNSPTKSSTTSNVYNVTKTYFEVPLDQQELFWVTYCQSIIDKKNPYISELVSSKTQNVQLGFDIFLAFERNYISIREDVIDDAIRSIHEYVKRIIGIIQATIFSYFERSEQGSEYLACYLCRNSDTILTWTNSQVEYKGRITFPYAFIQNGHVNQFYRLLLNQLQIQIVQLNGFLTLVPINGLDTIIRPINVDMTEMYGSSDSYDAPPFELYQIYGMITGETEVSVPLEKAFSPMFHTLCKTGTIKYETLIAHAQQYGWRFWLPLFFSNGYYSQPLVEKHAGFFSFTEEVPRVTLKTIKDSGDTQSHLERTRQLLSMLDKSRVDIYWSWYDIGSSLHSIDKGREGLNLWKWITTQSDFKGEQDCEEQWYQFNGSDGVTIATIEWFAIHDNPDQYMKFVDKEVQDAIVRAIFEQQEKPIAKAFRACFPFDFVCSNYESSDWYFYKDHRWAQDDGTSMLMWYLNEKFQPKLEKMRMEISQKVAGSRDAEFKSKSENTISAITELIKKLNGNSFKEKVCRELKLYYQCRRFTGYMDLNPNYTATPNGIIDLRGGRFSLRPGKPEDFLTKTTNCMFPETFTWETPVVKDVLAYIEKVFRSKALREYFWRLMGKLLYSGNIDKIFPIWTGEGNNSKSILVRLIEAALGSYAVKLPTTLITETGKDSGKATPVLIHSRGAKVAFLQEPDRDQKIKSGPVKEITGHDTMYVRELFQKGGKIVEMEITIVPFLITNKIPNIPDCQQAIWERTNVTEFTSRWDKNAPADPTEQYIQGLFPMDRFFDRQIPRMAPAFLWIMAQKYEEYYRDGLQPPEEVLTATEAFRVSNNKFIHFTRDCIVQVLDINGIPDGNARVSVDEMYNAYRKWYADQQYREKIDNKSAFKENIETTWRIKVDAHNGWAGIRLNSPVQAAAGGFSSLLAGAVL